VRLFDTIKDPNPGKGLLYELYPLTCEKKAQIDILLEQELSMRKTAEVLVISHSTISRYKANVYKKRELDIDKKYDTFI